MTQSSHYVLPWIHYGRLLSIVSFQCDDIWSGGTHYEKGAGDHEIYRRKNGNAASVLISKFKVQKSRKNNEHEDHKNGTLKQCVHSSSPNFSDHDIERRKQPLRFHMLDRQCWRLPKWTRLHVREAHTYLQFRLWLAQYHLRFVQKVRNPREGKKQAQSPRTANDAADTFNFVQFTVNLTLGLLMVYDVARTYLIRSIIRAS